MYPTIEPGDFIVVNKMYMSPLYKKLHLTATRKPCGSGSSSLKRNDVIVFNSPAHERSLIWIWNTYETLYRPRSTLFTTPINSHQLKLATETWMKQQRRTITAGEPREFTTLSLLIYSSLNIWIRPLYIPAAGTTITIDTQTFAIPPPDVAKLGPAHRKIANSTSVLLIRNTSKNWYFGRRPSFNSRP
ncbi:MAG: hypothetical protein ACLU4N_07390 [Butyricimonas faecihominis]